MDKNKWLTMFAAMLVCGSVSAAPLVDISLGVKQWESGSDSMFGEANDSLLSYTHSDESQYLLSAQLDHSIPLIPNARLTYQNLDFDSSYNLEQTFILAGTTFPVASNLVSNHELTIQDTTLYYEVLDVRLVTINLGVTGRYQEASVNIRETMDNTRSSSSADSYELLAHGRVNLDLPLFGFYGFAELNKGSDNELTMAGIGYEFDNTILPNIKIEFGVIEQKVSFDRDDGFIFEQAFDSSYLGLELVF
ncbi:TIGR04219 family outer membrane beta-barrel protein [Psychrosphaera ytuae]|uniref:TIGR04219 family outer membrane beta-barrel protein n=1 Tax=Psychrosphaera ytuae TaxID=2820710 RepID=A0A975HHI7_9GAMM|nr:TIGR04219 family outer membrane beta-barrel protein [Psychrosphaera ytuae]QTH63165.1 TIGR04219 family outer membrane beta-barrel protein [Psychrosphaera ytuae]